MFDWRDLLRLLLGIALVVQMYAAQGSGVQCAGASKCSVMQSCEQAYACLRDGDSGLDRDGDGVPCESICPGG